MKNSIVPEIINSYQLRFFDDNNIEVKLCPKSKFKFINPFQKPYLVIDIFPKKVTRPHDLINIGYDELLGLGYCIFSISAKQRKWYKGQTVIYVIGKKSAVYRMATKLKNPPSNIYIQKDRGNKRLRLLGINAGYPHNYENGGCGNWVKYNE